MVRTASDIEGAEVPIPLWELAHSRFVSVEALTELTAVVGTAGDTSATRTVYAMVIGLGVIGVALVVLAIWLIKQTKPDPQLLAPLERMDDRAWRKQAPAEMRRDLDSLRPPGAQPVIRPKDVPALDAEVASNGSALGDRDDRTAEPASEENRSDGVPSRVDPIRPADSDPAATASERERTEGDTDGTRDDGGDPGDGSDDGESGVEPASSRIDRT